jgi:L-lactate dehydrogenase (cytochrome)
MMRLDQCRNIADLRRRARRKLPAPMFHFIDGGAEDEVSLRRNMAAFADYELVADHLTDVSQIDTRATLLGKAIDLPLILSPTGMSRLFHRDRELGVARAAAKFGAFYALSTMATASVEEVAQHAAGPKIMQIYIFRDRELIRELVERAAAAGYDALCLTVDVQVPGNRERDLASGMTVPPSFNLRSLASFALSPGWTLDYLRDPNLDLANVAHRAGAPAGKGPGVAAFANAQFDRTVTWKDAAWLAGLWDGPFIIKGLQSPAAAKRALEMGASAIMISNHGGRQLDGLPAPIDCVAAMRDAVGDELELIVDGGVRRGTDIIKALAAGANACSVGRAYLYGLAAGGQAGVERALTILKTELERDLALLGCRNLAEVTARHLRHRGTRP